MRPKCHQLVSCPLISLYHLHSSPHTGNKHQLGSLRTKVGDERLGGGVCIGGWVRGKGWSDKLFRRATSLCIRVYNIRHGEPKWGQISGNAGQAWSNGSLTLRNQSQWQKIWSGVGPSSTEGKVWNPEKERHSLRKSITTGEANKHERSCLVKLAAW